MPQATDYAIVVGINHYTRPPFKALAGAVKDATDFCDWLKSPFGGDIPAANVDPFFVQSQAGMDRPTFSDLLRCINQLKGKVDENGKIGRRLYLFFAGHGVSPDELDEAGLVPVDAEGTLIPYLAGKECAAIFAKMCAFEEVVLFMDCCRSSPLMMQKCTIPITVKTMPGAGLVKRFSVFAAPFGEVAREVDTGGGVVRGVFSRMLIDRLNDRTGDVNRSLTTTLLRNHLEAQMKKLPQEQWFQFYDHGEIVLVPDLPGIATCSVHVTLATAYQRVEILDGGAALSVVASLSGGVTGTTVTKADLPTGKTYVCRAYFADGRHSDKVFNAVNPTHDVTL